jgi:hypothetical protein
MTDPAGTGRAVPIVVQISALPQEGLHACARVLARLAVEKAVEELGLDFGRTIGDDVGNPHKKGPAGADNTDRAKEQVLCTPHSRRGR